MYKHWKDPRTWEKSPEAGKNARHPTSYGSMPADYVRSFDRRMDSGRSVDDANFGWKQRHVRYTSYDWEMEGDNCAYSYDRWTALGHAMTHGTTAQVLTLLERGANPRTTWEDGKYFCWSPLSFCLMMEGSSSTPSAKQVDTLLILRALLDSGLSPNQRVFTSGGPATQDPVEFCIAGGYVRSLRVLLEYNASYADDLLDRSWASCPHASLEFMLLHMRLPSSHIYRRVGAGRVTLTKGDEQRYILFAAANGETRLDLSRWPIGYLPPQLRYCTQLQTLMLHENDSFFTGIMEDKYEMGQYWWMCHMRSLHTVTPDVASGFLEEMHRQYRVRRAAQLLLLIHRYRRDECPLVGALPPDVLQLIVGFVWQHRHYVPT